MNAPRHSPRLAAAQRAGLLLALTTFLCACTTHPHTDIGQSKYTLVRNGWAIHLQNIGSTNITDTDWGTTITAGAHKIYIGNGVDLDGRPIATATAGDVNITNIHNTVTLSINGTPIKIDN